MNETMEKLKEHDKLFEAIDRRFEAVDRRFEAADRRFDRLDSQFDLLAQKMVDHEERLVRIEENMVTKNDHQEVMKALDTLIDLFEKKDQELVMLTHASRRHEDKIAALDYDMSRVKPLVGLT